MPPRNIKVPLLHRVSLNNLKLQSCRRQYTKRGRKLGYRSETTKDDNAICEVGTKFNNKIFEE